MLVVSYAMLFLFQVITCVDGEASGLGASSLPTQVSTQNKDNVVQNATSIVLQHLPDNPRIKLFYLFRKQTTQSWKANLDRTNKTYITFTPKIVK